MGIGVVLQALKFRRLLLLDVFVTSAGEETIAATVGWPSGFIAFINKDCNIWTFKRQKCE
jgi:hypothetical protein